MLDTDDDDLCGLDEELRELNDDLRRLDDELRELCDDLPGLDDDLRELTDDLRELFEEPDLDEEERELELSPSVTRFAIIAVELYAARVAITALLIF